MILSETAPSPARVRAATRATYVAFIGTGFAFASWAARIPQVRDRLHLQPSELGLVLLAIAAGSVLALPLSGPVLARLGSRRMVSAMALLLSVGLVIVSLGYLAGVPPVVGGLFLIGLGNGAWDVAMNVQAARVERLLNRSIMSRFHAGFSLGTVAGAVIGAGMVALRVPVTAHLLGVAVVVAAVVPLAVQRFVPDQDEDSAEERGRSRDAWTEPRTLLIGLFVLAFAFAEGTGNDWISVALIDGHHSDATLGTLGFAVFLAAMTAGRWVGPGLLDRYGRVVVIRAISLLAVAGLVLFVFGPSTPVAFAGAVLWGAGTSLGFPVGMSAGADDPARAPARVSVIASIGYCAFLGGPPLIGFLGQRFTVLRALTAVAVLLALAALITGNVRPLPDGEDS
ncbi:MFS transporter [Actinoallomurus iriomotensis]|uniref:MFS transporter n=1 Tax=Actinoallomurus iriomotensis TaxID=478107 RepID=A0A9W6RM85_9ACTN|nr:MFS transporter [Actinoallomurus iriomotensis]GLY78791.1 MFS transporter [Actinoallomurus iriomotensis]